MRQSSDPAALVQSEASQRQSFAWVSWNIATLVALGGRELNVRRVPILVHTWWCRIICSRAARAGYCCSMQLPVRLPWFTGCSWGFAVG